MGRLLCGMVLCAIIALLATILGKSFEIIGAPVFSIIAGMLLARPLMGKSGIEDAIKPGLSFTSKYVLQFAVVLLGFGMNLVTVLECGTQSLPVIVTTISVSLLCSYVLCRVMNLPPKIATLVGVGSSICGGSAIAATAPVIKADDEEVAQAISVIFLFNVIAALVFPTLGSVIGLSNEGFGLFAGTAINDTSSVTAAATAWDGMHSGANALETATIVKLTRTLAIIPITLVLSLRGARLGRSAAKDEVVKQGSSFRLRNAVPVFVLLFVAAAVAATVLPLPSRVGLSLRTASKFCIAMAMAAIGLNTDLVKLVKTGGKPIALGGICWIAIACSSLVMQHLLGIW